MPSETVPDQATSMRELLKRVAKGISLEKAFDSVYFGDDIEFPNPRGMDLTELYDLKVQVRETFEAYEKDKKTWQQKQDKKRMDDLINSEVKKRLLEAQNKPVEPASTNPS